MPQSSAVNSRSLTQALAEPGNALLLDVDGTLLEIAARPEDVIIPKDLERTLIETQTALQGALAILTGRDFDFIDRVFPVLRPVASCSHGATLRSCPEGTVQETAPPVDVDALIATLGTHALPDIRIERKSHAVALHWRGSTDPGIAKAAAALAAQNLMNAYNAGRNETAHLALTHGDMVLEIGSRSADKGQALAHVMSLPAFFGRRPVFFGDSEADLPAMLEARARGGLAVAVGPAMSAHADHALSGPSDVLRILKAVSQISTSTTPTPSKHRRVPTP